MSHKLGCDYLALLEEFYQLRIKYRMNTPRTLTSAPLDKLLLIPSPTLHIADEYFYMGAMWKVFTFQYFL